MVDTLEETIKQVSENTAEELKGHIDIFLSENLEENEKLLHLAATAEDLTDLLYLTNERIFYFDRSSKQSPQPIILSYDEIDRTKLVCDEEKADLNIQSQQGDIIVKRIFLPVAEHVKESIDQRTEK